MGGHGCRALILEGAPLKLLSGGSSRCSGDADPADRLALRRAEIPKLKAKATLTLRRPKPTLYLMEIRLNSDLQAKLTQLASQRGRDTEALVVEAVERMVNYDDWFIGEVRKESPPPTAANKPPTPPPEVST